MGVPAMTQWVRNPATVAQVAAEVWVQSLAQERLHAVGVAKKIIKKINTKSVDNV